MITYASTFTGGTTALDTATTVYVSPVGAFDPTFSCLHKEPPSWQNNTTFTTVGNLRDRPMRPKSRLAASRSMERPSLPRTTWCSKWSFTPRYFAYDNVTDRIKVEWYEGMTADTCVKTAAAGTRTIGNHEQRASRFATLTARQHQRPLRQDFAERDPCGDRCQHDRAVGCHRLINPQG